jgi:RNA polymerase sigma-70 factor (ECF subfamily)
MKDEIDLIQAAKKLDQDALTTIFDIYASAIYAYVIHLCHDPIDSDNIVGDVFAQLLEQFAAGKGPRSNLRSYLYQIAYHLVVDGARQNQRVTPLEVVIELPAKLVTIPTQVEERVLMDALISTANDDLTDIQRHVIILRFLEGFSLRETADIIGTNINHIKVIQNRGIARLRKSLFLKLDIDKKGLSPLS